VPKANSFSAIFKKLTLLNSTDRLFILFWGLISLLSLILHDRIKVWPLILLANLLASLAVCLIAFLDQASPSRVIRWLHDWAAFPLVLFTYKVVYYLISPIHLGKDYDQLLIAMDWALFQVHPTQWMAGFANPLLTELLQIAYSLFYAFFLVIGIELYQKQDTRRFADCRFARAYGFLISYIGYFFLPAVGPRFTLHDFSRIDIELPGLFFTPSLRWFVNIFESIHAGASSSVALACAQRDVFPSGHTMLTLMMMVYTFRERLKVRYAILGAGILLIFATVYLRYHYFVDLLAGALLALFCLYTASRVQGFMKSEERS
jgi:membrane-associated phospholipid phosphatase